jgi:hypothetical protein
MPSPIAIIKSVLETFRPVRCDNCHLRKPSFNFPVLNWHETSWCRKCANVKIGDTSYFHEFSPFRDVIDHFLHNVGWFSGRREFA